MVRARRVPEIRFPMEQKMRTRPALTMLVATALAAGFLLPGSQSAWGQNRKGQVESDRFWEDFSKGLEWLTTSRSAAPAAVPSPLDIGRDSLNSDLTPQVDLAFDPDVHRILVIAHKRKVLHRKYNERWANERSRPSSASMAKSLVSLAVGKALCSGAIRDLDDEASTYSSRLGGTSWGRARVRHLLAMSSGANRPIYTPTGSPTPEVQAETLEKSYQGRMTRDFVDLMRSADERHSPSGLRGHYNNLDTQALAFLVEDATGMRFIDFFEREIWQPSGAAQPGRWMHNSHGQVAAFSGFSAHPYDWIRLGHHVLEQRATDSCFGNFLKEATRQQSKIILPSGEAPFGFQIWLGCGGTDAFCFAGHGGQRLVMHPSTGVVMYLHSTSATAVQPVFSLYRTVLARSRP